MRGLRRLLVIAIAAIAALIAGGPPLAAAATPADLVGAVSLGDSYSSGEGSGPFDPGTNVGQNRCHRASHAWPRVLGVPIDRHLACSGATIDDLAAGQTTLGPDDRGQLVRLAEIPVAPTHVFVTLGGNDAGFGDALTRCVLRPSCAGFIAARSRALPALGTRLEAAFRDIVAAARGGRVIVVGYPLIVAARPPGGPRCPWLGDTEVPALRGFIRALDRTIFAAAQRAGVEFAPVAGALAGHELCAPVSWMFPILLNPLSTNPQQAHPRPLGQAAIARGVTAYLEANPLPPETPTVA